MADKKPKKAASPARKKATNSGSQPAVARNYVRQQRFNTRIKAMTDGVDCFDPLGYLFHWDQADYVKLISGTEATVTVNDGTVVWASSCGDYAPPGTMRPFWITKFILKTAGVCVGGSGNIFKIRYSPASGGGQGQTVVQVWAGSALVLGNKSTPWATVVQKGMQITVADNATSAPTAVVIP